MKFLSYLNEENSLSSLSDEEIIDLIRKDCSYFIKLRESEKRIPIVRATKKPIEKIQKFFQRFDRKPLDTPIEFSELLNTYLKKIFKWEPRKQGTFAQSSYFAINSYGKVYFFFPIGEFKFIWNTKINDFFMFLENMEIVWKTNGGIKVNYNIPFDKVEEILRKQVLPYYVDNDLVGAIKSGHEIMFNCLKGYYLIEENYELYGKILGW